MADDEHMADPSDASQAPLDTTATTTVQAISDSTTMEALNASDLSKFLYSYRTVIRLLRPAVVIMLSHNLPVAPSLRKRRQTCLSPSPL